MRDNQLKTCPAHNKIPMGNYIVMLLMSVVFAIQFLGDPRQIYLSGLILKNASINAFLVHFWLHVDLIHIVSNMLLLAVFGRRTCIKIGNARYILFYFILGFTAAIAHVLLDGRPVIGSSGAISGILGLAVVLFWRKLSPMGPWLVFIWFAISAAAAIAGNSPDAHVAHIAGFIMGMILATTLIVCNQTDHSDTGHSLIQIIQSATLIQSGIKLTK